MTQRTIGERDHDPLFAWRGAQSAEHKRDQPSDGGVFVLGHVTGFRAPVGISMTAGVSSQNLNARVYQRGVQMDLMRHMARIQCKDTQALWRTWMSDQPKATNRLEQFDQPCAHLATLDATHAPWAADANRGKKDRAGHRRYHGLYEDMMN